MNLQGLCPMNTGQINIQSNIAIPEDVKSRIPSIAYGVPDLDGLVRIYINNTAGVSVACVEAQLSNGKTVDQKAVGWTTAVIAGLALLAAAVTSGLGHSNTAAHVAANSLSLFGFFQAQAMIGMTSVTLPPIVQSWTQNFQWSMGIIRIGFVQDVCTWYQRSTGGNPSTLLSTLATTSVEVEKRSLDTVHRLFLRAYDQMNKRSNNDSTLTETTKLIIVRGIQRVGFRAGIEITNIFMTGLIFFMIFLVFVVVVVAAFKAVCELLVRAGRLKGDKFQDFRNGWRIVLKGILFRVVSSKCIVHLTDIADHCSGANWVSANMRTLFLGTDPERFGRRSCIGNILLHLHVHLLGLGSTQGHPARQAFGEHAQEPCVHTILRSSGTQQMGLSLRSIPGNGVLLHSPGICIHSGQVGFHWTLSKIPRCPGSRTGDHRSSLPHQCEHPTPVDGQEDQRLQHNDCRYQFP